MFSHHQDDVNDDGDDDDGGGDARAAFLTSEYFPWAVFDISREGGFHPSGKFKDDNLGLLEL